MPIYEYSCARCGCRFEVLQRMGDKKAPPCEGCGSKRTERMFSTFAMRGGGGGEAGAGGGGGGGCSGCSSSNCSGCSH